MVGFYDITNRKKVEIALRQSEEKFREIFNSSKDAILITDFDGKFLEVNKTALERTGLPYEILLQYSVLQIIHKKDVDEAKKLFREISPENPVVFNSEYLNANGERVFIEINASVFEYNGSPAVLHFSRDITERKLLQQKIVQAIIEAEEKECSYFSQELHDGLGPILSTIKLYLQWMESPNTKTNKSQLLKESLNTLEEAIHSLKEISNRLSPNVLEKFGLESAIQSFILKLRNATKIDFELHLDIGERLRIDFETMLYRVLVEAMNNTIKYAKADKVYISLCHDKHSLYVQYNDNGVGFDVDSALSKGLGNGLFNMQNRIKTYEGDLLIKSKPGEGTQIDIKLPFINK